MNKKLLLVFVTTNFLLRALGSVDSLTMLITPYFIGHFIGYTVSSFVLFLLLEWLFNLMRCKKHKSISN